jgi:hypothetical protein
VARGHAGASVLCGRQSGGHIVDGATIKLRQSCKSNELAVNPLELGLTSPPHLLVRTGNTITTNGSVSTAASCEDGEVATGGGALATGANGGLPVTRSSHPQPDDPGSTPTGWRVTIVNTADSGTSPAWPTWCAPLPDAIPARDDPRGSRRIREDGATNGVLATFTESPILDVRAEVSPAPCSPCSVQ